MNEKIMKDILEILTSLDNRIIELEHNSKIKNKYYNDGERLKISKIKDEIRRMPK